MTNTSSNWENILIYYANLSSVYLCSCLFTLVAVFSTWWCCRRDNLSNDPQTLMNKVVHKGKESMKTLTRREVSKKHLGEESNDISAEARRLAAETLSSEHSVMRQVKEARQSAIEKQLTAGLSKEQLRKEKETQASQLEAIYKLLKEKEEHFQIRSMDELQDQLKLYRS